MQFGFQAQVNIRSGKYESHFGCGVKSFELINTNSFKLVRMSLSFLLQSKSGKYLISLDKTKGQNNVIKEIISKNVFSKICLEFYNPSDYSASL